MAFYRDVLGLPLIRRDGDEWAEFDAGPIRVALHGGGEASRQRHDRVPCRRSRRGAHRADGPRRGVDVVVGEVEGFARFARCVTPTATRCS